MQCFQVAVKWGKTKTTAISREASECSVEMEGERVSTTSEAAHLGVKLK